MYDDIPEAIRQSASVKEPTKSNPPIVGLALGATALGAIAIAGLFFLRPQPSTPPQSVAQQPSTAPTNAASATPTPVASPTSDNSKPDQLLGHLAYNEAPLSELEPISADGQITLRKAAAIAYRQMSDAAAAAGVRLAPLSGFRSKSDQTELFFRVKEQRNQGVTKRAEVSAPPGYSEHHTGYAIDIGDADRPDTHLSQNFEETPAFEWLSNHAAQYSFELSFTRDNPQGVSYEPWHWRFVGDAQSLETFYRAQNLNPGSN